MGRELDKRDFSTTNVTATRTAELNSLAAASSDRLPGNQTITIDAMDAVTGNAAVVRAEASPIEEGDHIQRALNFLQEINPALGFTPSQPVEFQADPNVQRTSSGAVAVNFQQSYKGIKVFQASQKVRFGPDDALRETVGHTVSVATPVEVAPRLTVTDAVRRAAEHVAVPNPDEQGELDQFGQPLPLASVDVSGFQPTIIATFGNEPTQPTVLEAGPFGDEIKANLVWFPLNETLRLGWEVVIAMPAYAGLYRTIVDAENGDILYCQQLVQTAVARGPVFRVDPGVSPESTDFPRLHAEYETQYGLPAPTMPVIFREWVFDDKTVGNSTNAHQGDNGPPLQGSAQGNVVTFNPADASGVDQQVLNIFYFNCVMHDVLEDLGFDAAAGNFEHDNNGAGGLQSDSVDARAHPMQIFGIANMFTPADGLHPVMNMGRFDSTGRHTAFDSSVVFHEFTHGLTNRLVGGPNDEASLAAPQSRGMGEGWSDYMPCTLNNTIVVGDWLTNRPGGIRGFPYDSNFPDNYGDVGTGRYTGPHAIGEIWAATLMEMNRNIGSAFGLQLVVDALKLTASNPSFLDARDAILRALDDMQTSGQLSASEHAAKRRGIWEAFAKFGMGTGAQANNGPQLTGIVANFDLPADLPPADG
jgi:extracellular elastinolytic metalloproteinase